MVLLYTLESAPHRRPRGLDPRWSGMNCCAACGRRLGCGTFRRCTHHSFGSAARGDGEHVERHRLRPIRAPHIAAEDVRWREQLEALAASVVQWNWQLFEHRRVVRQRCSSH